MTNNETRPLITFVLLAYNQERFIREAIEGAFSQTYSPLEIILSDDCSCDKTFEIMTRMAEAYVGQHKIILNRNERNLGPGYHLNRAMEMSTGELIVGAAGDDISRADRVDKIYEVYSESGGSAKSIFSNSTIIDTTGKPCRRFFSIPPNPVGFSPEMIVKGNYILTGCSHAWAREVIDLFGFLQTPLTCEDMVIPFRSALTGEIRYVHEELVMYRRHDTNIWPASPVDPPKDYKKWEHLQLKERLAIFGNWLRDLDRFEKLCPAEQDRIEYLRRNILERSARVRDDLDLMESPWIKKGISLLRELTTGGSVRALRYRTGIFLIPKIYNRYMMFKNARR